MSSLLTPGRRLLLSLFFPLSAAGAMEPLGTGMEGFAYPYAVQMLDLRMEGEPVRMAYMDVPPAGEANGRTVVLLHGRNFFGAYCSGTIDALSRAGYRVIVPDQIGFGKSSKPDVPHSLSLHAQNTAKLLDALGVKQASLVAHSLGGMMAVRFAIMYPQRVDRLVLESPIGLEDYSAKVPYPTREELTAEAIAQTREDIDRFFRGFFAQWRPAFQQYADVQHRWLIGPEAHRIARTAAATYLMAYEQPVVYVLPLVRQPTLLIAGDKDRAAIGRNRVAPEVRDTLGRYTELAPKAAGALPNGRLLMLQDVGHVAHLEVPERFNQEVLSFLAQRE